MNYSKGISWFDDCRIPFVDGDKTINHNTQPGSFVGSFGSSEKIYKENTNGRYPANLLCSDDMLNDGSISGVDKTISITSKKNDLINWGFDNTTDRQVKYDKGSNSRYYDIDAWFNNLIENNIY